MVENRNYRILNIKEYETFAQLYIRSAYFDICIFLQAGRY